MFPSVFSTTMPTCPARRSVELVPVKTKQSPFLHSFSSTFVPKFTNSLDILGLVNPNERYTKLVNPEQSNDFPGLDVPYLYVTPNCFLANPTKESPSIETVLCAIEKPNRKQAKVVKMNFIA